MLILKYLKNRFVQFAMFILLAAVCASIDTNLGGAAGIIMATGAAVASTKRIMKPK